MTANFSNLASLVRDFHHSVAIDLTAGDTKPVVVLLHGLGGNCDDLICPFQDRNWPYDHRSKPAAVDLGIHSTRPPATHPSITIADFLSPRFVINSNGADGSDDRSWWHALVGAGFPVMTYSQLPQLMMPFTQGPVGEFKQFMQILQRDVLVEPEFRSRPVVIVGHSRGGLIGRAYLGDAEVKADQGGRFPNVAGLITISSPHAGSQVALLDDKMLAFLNQVQQILPDLPTGIASQIINSMKAMVNAYFGPFVDEIHPNSPMYQAMEAQEPIRPGVRYISVGGTSPRYLRVYLWTVSLGRTLPGSEAGTVAFSWWARPVEAKVVSPVLDGLWVKALGLKLDELIRGRGDGLTSDKSCYFPKSFNEEEHLSVPLNHGEELWDGKLQQTIIQRLETFH